MGKWLQIVFIAVAVPDHPIYIHFSESVRLRDFSFSISPDPGQWDLSWENKGRDAVLDHAASFQSGVDYTLRGIDSRRCPGWACSLITLNPNRRWSIFKLIWASKRGQNEIY